MHNYRKNTKAIHKIIDQKSVRKVWEVLTKIQRVNNTCSVKENSHHVANVPHDSKDIHFKSKCNIKCTGEFVFSEEPITIKVSLII